MGHIVDSILGFFGLASPNDEIVEKPRTLLVLESHLIGDGVMTMAFINSFKTQCPDTKVILLAQNWMQGMLPKGLVDRCIPCHLPWVGEGKLSFKRWKDFYSILSQIKNFAPDAACETRGDWRNFLIFWLLGIPTRVGVSMSGGERLLTHKGRMVQDTEPLYATRKALLEMFGLDSSLQLPDPPQPGLDDKKSGSFVVVHPGASQPLRRMSEAQMNVVLQKIPKTTSHLIVASGPGELGLQQKCLEYFSGRGLHVQSWAGGLLDFVRLCGQSEAVFAMDSGPAHLAAWSGSRTHVFCNHDSPNIVAPL